MAGPERSRTMAVRPPADKAPRAKPAPAARQLQSAPQTPARLPSPPVAMHILEGTARTPRAEPKVKPPTPKLAATTTVKPAPPTAAKASPPPAPAARGTASSRPAAPTARGAPPATAFAPAGGARAQAAAAAPAAAAPAAARAPAAAPARAPASAAAPAAPPAEEEAPAAATPAPETAAPAEAPAAPPEGAKREPRAETEPAAGEGDKGEKAEGGKPGTKGAAAKAPAPPSPRKAIGPAITAVGQRARRARAHSPNPGIPVGSAQAASKAPRVEQARGSATATVKSLEADAGKTAKLRRQEFKDSLKKAISAATEKPPKTEAEGRHVMEQGAKEKSQALTGEMGKKRDAAVGPLKDSATAQDVPADAPKESKLVPEPLGPAPAPVSAAPVVPAPLPEEQLDYSEHRGPTDSAMAEAGVSKEQLEKGNEPAFNQTLAAREQAEQHEQAAPATYREGETKIQDRTKHAAQAELARGVGGMQEARAEQIAGVIGQQLGTKDKEAAERQRVTDRITAIKNETRSDVEAILSGMEQTASMLFEQGLQLAEARYHSVFEEEKGGAWNWLTNWGDDWRDLIEGSLAKAFSAYQREVDATIDRVADFVDNMLENARNRITRGRQQVDEFVGGLEGKALEFGLEAQKAVAEEFDAMETQVDERRDALVSKLVDQYKASYERMKAMEEKLRAENQSLWDKIYNATIGLIKKILAFKDMLFNVLAKAASVIGDIISDPIGFLGNLVSAVMRGLKNFMANIGTHLKKGLMEWLFGALAGAGLQLPDTFDLKGIVSIVLQVLGLTYANFRARAVNIVGEPVVAALEQAADVFKIIITEGIPGLWRFIKEKLEDLKSMVLDAIFDFIKEKVLIAGVTWIIGLLNPASAFFKACKAIYDIVMFFVERGSQILELVNAIIDSIAAIARGSLDTAAAWVEKALAKTIPVAIGFLASLLGLGDISGTIRKTIEKAQAPVNKAIDWVINQAVKLVKAAGKFIGKLFGAKDDKAAAHAAEHDTDLSDPRERAAAKLVARLGSKEHSEKEAEEAVASIRDEERAGGLSELYLGKAREDGSIPVFAAASAAVEAATFYEKKEGTTVTSIVKIELDEADTGALPENEQGIVYTRIQSEPNPEIQWLETDRPHGQLVAPGRTQGGIRRVHPEHKNTLEIKTWNSGAGAPQKSHAEHQMVHYLEQNINKDPQWGARIKAIEIRNLPYTACDQCSGELADLADRIADLREGRRPRATISAARLFQGGRGGGGFSPHQQTTMVGVRRLRDSKWTVDYTQMPPSDSPGDIPRLSVEPRKRPGGQKKAKT